MSTNAQKTWLGLTQNEFARKKIQDAIQVLGKSLPASVVAVNGAIVTVKFDLDASPFPLPQITVPIETSIYARAPIQIGDKGWVKSADVRLGGTSGLGDGTPNLTAPANLTALVWSPIGNAGWEPSPDANAYLLQGPNGFILRNMNADYSIVGNDSGMVLTFKTNAKITMGESDIIIDWGEGTATIRLDDDGVHLTGAFFINGDDYMAHEHSGVTTGSGNTGGVV